MCLAHLQSNKSDFNRDLVKSSISSLDPILYGPEFRACIASVCLVKVVISQHSSHCCSWNSNVPSLIGIFSIVRPIYVALMGWNPFAVTGLLPCRISRLRCGSPSYPLFRYVHISLKYLSVMPKYRLVMHDMIFCGIYLRVFTEIHIDILLSIQRHFFAQSDPRASTCVIKAPFRAKLLLIPWRNGDDPTCARRWCLFSVISISLIHYHMFLKIKTFFKADLCRVEVWSTQDHIFE
jgi:hypothetical protein